MNTRRMMLIMVALSTVCFAGDWSSAGGKKSTWKRFLPPEVMKELVAREAKIAAKTIDSDKFETHQRGRAAALMIAGYAKSAKNPKEWRTLLPPAIQLASLIGEDGKQAEAKKLARALSKLDVGTANSAVENLNFKQYVNNDYYLMVQYMSKKKGGDGLHPKLQFSSRLRGSQEYIENLFSYVSKRPLREKYWKDAAKELELVGYRTAVSGQLIAKYEPTRKRKKRDPAVWRKTSQDMITHALAFAAAAKKKDSEALQKAASGVLASCVNCHKMFQR